ncbi:MAG: endo-1,4-beta-xylanase [Spirochaetales bacterium]|nr:endo-1,4-beta-xylanase [Spirochaetales bacterium]
MKRMRVFFVIFFTLFVIAFPTDTPSQTDTSFVTAHAAVLYSGPGNAGYETLAELAQGTTVVPLALFGDFIKVRAALDGKTLEGFIAAILLKNLPGDLPGLDEDHVPWTEMVNIAAMPVWNTWSTWIEHGKLKHQNKAVLYNGYLTLVYDYEPIHIPDKFVVQLQFTGQGHDYGIVLYGRLNTGGEWWSGIRRLDISVYNGSLSLLFFDGTKIEAATFNLPQRLKGKRITLRLRDKGSVITVSGPDGKSVTENPIRLSAPLCPDHMLYVGLNAAPKAEMEVSCFSIRVPPSGKYITLAPEDSETQFPPLRELAEKRGIEIGAMLGLEGLRNTNIFTREFNRLVSEDFHWALIRPSRTSYDFSRTDLIVEFTGRNRIPVEAHHLVWGAKEHLPDWLKNGKFSREELLAILHEHINTVVTRYKGKVRAWSIANEVTSRTLWGNSDLDFWYKNIGPEYVELAFRWAREADPDAVLILNDDHNEGGPTQNDTKIADAMYELVRTLKKKGVPVDGVGMQMHLLSPFAFDKKHAPQKDKVTSTMKRFAALGVDIYVTEFDVNLSQVPGTQKQKWAFQAKVYADMLQACLKVPACKSFSIFGISDAFSWYNVCDGCLNLPNAEPLPFDRNYNPKPAYYAIRDVLTKK